MATTATHHDIRDLIRLFNGLFQQRYQTILTAGNDEPVYLPADADSPCNRIVFAHGFFASALHEIGHWCVAGTERRQLEDYGYWYKPDGRTAQEQAEFERVEVRPQAYEWIFSAAAGHPFHFSADNLDGGCGPSASFKQSVRNEVVRMLQVGLAERPRQLSLALTAFYGTAGPEALLMDPKGDYLMSPPNLAIETHALSKQFGSNRAVDGVDLVVPQGMVYGVLGPNGAGKTTTLRMLATLIPPNGGEAFVLGHNIVTEPARIRQKISLTGQFASVDEDLTGFENLCLMARLLGFSRREARTRADNLLQAFELTEAATRSVKYFSGGMRRRLDIAASLIVTPQLLFLDEPTTGLDPRSRNQVWDMVRALVGAGTTVVLTTQYLEEADQLADRIAVIDHGRVIAEGTSQVLKASVGSNMLHVTLDDPMQLDLAVQMLRTRSDRSVQAERADSALHIQLKDPDEATEVLSLLAANRIRLSRFAMGQPSLDEVFMALTGQPASEQASDVEVQHD